MLCVLMLFVGCLLFFHRVFVPVGTVVCMCVVIVCVVSVTSGVRSYWYWCACVGGSCCVCGNGMCAVMW